jgi:hypothetical protein
VDFFDFFDYATSPLAKKITEWPFDRPGIQHYFGRSTENSFDIEFRHEDSAKSNLNLLGMSIGTVGTIKSDALYNTYGIFSLKKEADPQERYYILAEANSLNLENGEHTVLDRYIFAPLAPDLNRHNTYSGNHLFTSTHQTKFLLDHYTDLKWFKEHCENVSEETRLEQIDHYSEVDRLFTSFENAFEVLALAPHFPDYFDFMYDLITSEKIQDGYSIKKKKQKRIKGKPRKIKEVSLPNYRLVKSIRVNHSVAQRPQKAQETLERRWKSPARFHQVCGYYRHFKDRTWSGKDSDGTPIKGKTWVRDHHRGNHAIETHRIEKRREEPILVKQTLKSARDLIAATESAVKKGASLPPDALQGANPSEEFKYEQRSLLSSALRYVILQRDGFKCQLCGRTAEDNVKLEVDHIKPIAAWGLTEEGNLRVLCKECNRGKGSKLEKEL